MELKKKCSGCKKDKLFVKRRSTYHKLVKQKVTTLEEFCNDCWAKLLKMLESKT